MYRVCRGFTLAEVLLTLLIVSAMIPITLLCLSPFTYLLNFSEEIQDQIALSQLRRILLLSYDIEYAPHQMNFVYQHQLRSLYCVNNHLIMTPGTQIYLSQIDEAWFNLNGDCIYVVYERKGSQYEKILCQQS